METEKSFKKLGYLIIVVSILDALEGLINLMTAELASPEFFAEYKDALTIFTFIVSFFFFYLGAKAVKLGDKPTRAKFHIIIAYIGIVIDAINGICILYDLKYSTNIIYDLFLLAITILQIMLLVDYIKQAKQIFVIGQNTAPESRIKKAINKLKNIRGKLRKGRKK